MRLQQPTRKLDAWKSAIDQSRKRREKLEPTWAEYARLHTNAYRAVKQGNDSSLITLPNGDQVKVALVYRNIEQTLALLDMESIGVRAEATDYTHELGFEDSHREQVVEACLHKSLSDSDLLRSEVDALDDIKLDGTIVGHGINYTHYRIIEEEIEVEQIPVLQESETGAFLPVVDDAGNQKFESRKEKRVVYQAVEDEPISPLEFLFSSTAKKIQKSPWYGFERPVPLDELRRDPRFHIPKEVVGSSYKIRDLYGRQEDAQEDEFMNDAVMVIVAYDKLNRELIHFIEWDKNAVSRPAKKSTGGTPAHQLIPIFVEQTGNRFPRREDSPFSFYIPIPARDDPFGISQVEHIKNPALEADKLRTRAANLTRQLQLIVLYDKNKIDADELLAAMRSDEATPVGVNVDQDMDELKRAFAEVDFAKIPKEIYTHMGMSEEDVRKIEGIAEIPFGGAETATESENQMAVGGARPKRKQRKLFGFLSSVARRHLDYLREFAPDGQTIATVGVDGTPMTLNFGREALFGQFKITVQPGGGASSVSPVRQKAMLDFAGMTMGKYGPQFDSILVREAAVQLDIRNGDALARAAQAGFLQPGPPGQPPAGGTNPNDISNGQAIRQAINSPNEGGSPR